MEQILETLVEQEEYYNDKLQSQLFFSPITKETNGKKLLITLHHLSFHPLLQ